MSFDFSVCLVYGFEVTWKFSHQLPSELQFHRIGCSETDEYNYFVIVRGSKRSTEDCECICNTPTFPLDLKAIEALVKYREKSVAHDETGILGECGWYMGMEIK